MYVALKVTGGYTHHRKKINFSPTVYTHMYIDLNSFFVYCLHFSEVACMLQC